MSLKYFFEEYPQAFWHKVGNITLVSTMIIHEAYPAYTDILLNKTAEDLPIHIVVKSKAPLDVIKIFLETSRNEVQNLDGDLPIHIALKESATDEVIKILFEV